MNDGDNDEEIPQVEEKSSPLVLKDQQTEKEPEKEPEESASEIPPYGARREVIETQKWQSAQRANPRWSGSIRYFSHLGGKEGATTKSGKHIADLIEGHREPGQIYIEPFVGGGNVLYRISGERVASDANELLIDFWHAIQDGWYPEPTIPSKAYYEKNRKRWAKADDFSSLSRDERAQLLWTAYAPSHSGSWFNGYGLNKNGKTITSTRTLDKQILAIEDVEFIWRTYTKYWRSGCLMYCDPPYRPKPGNKKVKGYEHVGDFDFDGFWDWAAKMARKNTVLVSERTLPPGRYIAGKQAYMAGAGQGRRKEWLIRVRSAA